MMPMLRDLRLRDSLPVAHAGSQGPNDFVPLYFPSGITLVFVSDAGEEQ
jgi:hypothetical protein